MWRGLAARRHHFSRAPTRSCTLGASPTRHAATSSSSQKPLLASGRYKGLSAHCLVKQGHKGLCDRCWARSPQEAQLYKPRESVLGWYWARMCGHLLLPSPLPPPAAAASLRTGLFGKNPGSPGSPHSAVHMQRPRGCPSMQAPPCLSLVESVSPGLLRSTLSGNQWHFPLLCP